MWLYTGLLLYIAYVSLLFKIFANDFNSFFGLYERKTSLMTVFFIQWMCVLICY